jgi:hypothetical protein
MQLFRRKNLTAEELIEIAKKVCVEQGWPWAEPVQVQNRLFNWIIVTNYDKIGRNVRVTISKRSGNPVQWSFIPR